jgi:hypothetical protein
MTFFSNKFYVSFSNESATRISTHSVRAQEGWLNTGILLKTKQKNWAKNLWTFSLYKFGMGSDLNPKHDPVKKNSVSTRFGS